MAYLDLTLRTVTEPGLMQVFIKFLLDEDKFDGQRMLDIIVERLNSQDSRVSKKKTGGVANHWESVVNT